MSHMLIVNGVLLGGAGIVAAWIISLFRSKRNSTIKKLEIKNIHDYHREKQKLLTEDESSHTGTDMFERLWGYEIKVNKFLMDLKRQEIQKGFEEGNYPPSKHFFKVKDYITQSDIFKIIRLLPKGAALHIHEVATVDVRWIISQFTYHPNLYMCYDSDQQVQQMRYFRSPPTDSEFEWLRVVDCRRKHGNDKDFDEFLFKNLSMVVEDPDAEYPDINTVWKKFQGIFFKLFGFLLYEDTFRTFFRRSLEEFYEDNVQYLETRVTLLPLYDLDGNEKSKEDCLKLMIEVTEEFAREHEDFTGVKYIYNALRSQDVSAIEQDIKLSLELQEKFPDVFLGYDLVGEEEGGHPLSYFVEEFLKPRQEGKNLRFFFHAGETAWSGTEVDKNLVDAVLLDTVRIGHGYAITKHPAVKQMARNKGIAVEVCPLSNQILKLVGDLRNHPAADLLAEGFPVVISSDDPGLWGAKGLSYDWYAAFMGLGGQWADLRTLKQLAMNSLRYSALSVEERREASLQWFIKWEAFIKNVVDLYDLTD